MHAKFEGENLKIERAVSILVKWVSIMWSNLKVVHEQSGKVEYERERVLGIALKIHELLAIPSSLSRSCSTFPLCSWTTLIEIAVYTR